MEPNLESLLPLSFFFPPVVVAAPGADTALEPSCGLAWPALPPGQGLGNQVSGCPNTWHCFGALRAPCMIKGRVRGGACKRRSPLGSACSWLGAFWLPEMTSFLYVQCVRCWGAECLLWGRRGGRCWRGGPWLSGL